MSGGRKKKCKGKKGGKGINKMTGVQSKRQNDYFTMLLVLMLYFVDCDLSWVGIMCRLTNRGRKLRQKHW